MTRKIRIEVVYEFDFDPKTHQGMSDEAVLSYYRGGEGLEAVEFAAESGYRGFTQTARFVEG